MRFTWWWHWSVMRTWGLGLEYPTKVLLLGPLAIYWGGAAKKMHGGFYAG